jgi:hypothetical protein
MSEQDFTRLTKRQMQSRVRKAWKSIEKARIAFEDGLDFDFCMSSPAGDEYFTNAEILTGAEDSITTARDALFGFVRALDIQEINTHE